ncbi:MAG: glucokinase [Dehalococcoidia bacterium]
MLLAGDIGGTKTILAMYSREAGPRAPLVQAEFASSDFPSLEAMVQQFLATTSLEVDATCFDVAGPVVDGRAELTNLPWTVDSARLSRDLRLKQVHVMNDLEATAKAVPSLRQEDLCTLAPGEPVAGGAIAVIAPGTGLGEAFLTWDGLRYRAHPSEGGHADFAPTNDGQVRLLAYLRERVDHVSFELVASGIGIPSIYDFLRDSGHARESPELAERLGGVADRAHLIIDAVLATSPDPLSTAALDMFVSILGSEAGNLALKLFATGGVYLAGGIPRAILPLLKRGQFVKAFQRKGRLSDLLSRVPVHVIVCPAALIGAAIHVLEMSALSRQRLEAKHE